MLVFVAIGNDWKLLIVVKKSSVLDVYGLLDLTPAIALQWSVSQKNRWGLVNGVWNFIKAKCALSVSVL